MNLLTEWIIGLHSTLGPTAFLCASLATAAVLCFYITPVTTDLMVNHSAGLTGRFLGHKYRTYVINASTNNPEAANMMVSFAMLKFGGWANPLGSLLANFYLIFLFAPVITFFMFWFRGQKAKISEFLGLLKKEKGLVVWHVSICFICAAVGYTSLFMMQDKQQVPQAFGLTPTDSNLPNSGPIAWAVLALLVVTTAIVVLLARKLQKRRPALFEEIDSSDHGESVWYFLFGTAGLVLASWLLNAMFLAWEHLYTEVLTKFLGSAVFTILHFVVGALITSLPEMLVAVKNYQRLKTADLNTALGSATFSNIVNMMLCIAGLVYFIFFAVGGKVMPWE